ncbi:hypothetical protein [Pelagicoccus sp. SDUM812003]|uniref:hypothetical protein n=1 Tax=Pelagicoccus sp. SDUM812003 TaxID=3041267 RepID=UPI00280C592B|nr:hypothetical protein [Pelagicoccus sp. SDUM812003]MDQ8204025.1 hypothetical protein [Pelagicoccus sp. SDUM812003]
MLTSSLPAQTLLLIQGAAGEESFREGFDRAADTWVELAEQADLQTKRIQQTEQGIEPADQVVSWIAEQPEDSELWIVYIGHGTHSSTATKLNLVGKDLSVQDIAAALRAHTGNLIFIHGGSASAPFIPALSGEKRVIITATRSGSEQNYARFGEYFAQALASDQSDLDRDGSVSLLEAYLSASQAVDSYYFEAGRLATEHALIDDNGDGRGSQAELFDGLRAAQGVDIARADGRLARRVSLKPPDESIQLTSAQRELRNKLELQLEQLQGDRDSMSDAEYFRELEAILSELSVLYLPSEAEDS